MGDPPIVIIVSDSRLIRKGINFGNITMRMAPGAAICVIVAIFVVRLMMRKYFSQEVFVSAEMLHIRKEILCWENVKKPLTGVGGEKIIIKKLSRKIWQLNRKLSKIPKRYSKKEVNIDKLKKEYRITDRVLLIKSLVILTIVIVMFFTQSVIQLHLNLGESNLIRYIAVYLVYSINIFYYYNFMYVRTT